MKIKQDFIINCFSFDDVGYNKYRKSAGAFKTPANELYQGTAEI